MGAATYVWSHTRSYGCCFVLPMANALPGPCPKGDEGVGVPAARAQGSIHANILLHKQSQMSLHHGFCCIIPVANALPGPCPKGDEGVGVPAARSGVLPHMHDHTRSYGRCCIIPMANALPRPRPKGDEGIGVPAAGAQGSLHEPLWLECLGIREVVRIMVHPQDVEGYLCASWQCVTSQVHCSFRFTNLQQQDTTVEPVQVSWKDLCRHATFETTPA